MLLILLIVNHAGLRPVNLLKKRLWHRCFPVNFVKYLRTPFLQNTSGRLLLTKEELTKMVLEYQNKFDNILSNINTELTSLRDSWNGISAFSYKESER